MTEPCYICGKEGRFRYAPCDPHPSDPSRCAPEENQRWRCTEHQPYDATYEGWNGEWDDYFYYEPCA